MPSNDVYLFIGIALGLFIPIFDNAIHRLSIKLFGEFKDGL